MIKITKSKPPRELLVAIRELRRTPNARVCYEELKGAKQQTKESLVREQHGLCAYCMRKIRADERASIEHIIPQRDSDGTRHDAESVDYGNMLAVCRPKDGPSTCDRSRKNTPMKVNPLNEDTLRGIRYTREGKIYSDDPAVNVDLDNTLNLNCEDGYMCEGRAEAWGEVDQIIYSKAEKCGNSNRRLLAECKKMKQSLLSSDLYPEYAGVILFRLDHFIRKFSR